MQKRSLELLAQVQKIIDSYDFALTLRQIYYQLIARQVIRQPIDGKEAKRVYKRLSNLCKNGRDEGLLPEEKFTDPTRVFDKLSSWLDLNEFMQTVRQSYNKDKWQNQPKYLEIWTEKQALQKVINKITYKYDIGLQIAKGQYARTGIYETSLRYKAQSDKKCLLYYVGDYDPSGLSIYNSIKERLINYGIDVEIPDRIALTKEQIEKYKLPSDRAKKSDPNYNKFVEITGYDRVVELDSLPPDILRKIIEDCILKNIDQELLAQVQEKERDEEIKLNKFIEKGI